MKFTRRAWSVTEPAGKLSRCTLPVQGSLNAQASRELTVMSANLWHDWPRYRRLEERLEGFARLAEGEKADVILLQEVSRTPALDVDRWLSERLGMASVYSRVNGHSAIGFEEGLAVLSRFPLGGVYLRPFRSRYNPFVRRLALGALVETPKFRLLAFSVHLSLLKKQNAAQVSHLVEWISGIAGGKTALVGGDFNSHETTRQIAHARRSWLDTFRHLHPEADGTTHTLRLPWGGILRRQRLDYIFYLPGELAWEVCETRHLSEPGRPHSDHHAVVTRLALPEQPVL